jgi:hypothetical protein
MIHRPKLVPELDCSNLDFYQNLLGFQILYSRPEKRFAYLHLAGVELTLDEIQNGETQAEQGWNTGILEKLFGRGINRQFEVAAVDSIYERLVVAHWPIFLEIHDAWYRADKAVLGNRLTICCTQVVPGLMWVAMMMSSSRNSKSLPFC